VCVCVWHCVCGVWWCAIRCARMQAKCLDLSPPPPPPPPVLRPIARRKYLLFLHVCACVCVCVCVCMPSVCACVCACAYGEYLLFLHVNIRVPTHTTHVSSSSYDTCEYTCTNTHNTRRLQFGLLSGGEGQAVGGGSTASAGVAGLFSKSVLGGL
jgi:hypothetical protein